MIDCALHTWYRLIGVSSSALPIVVSVVGVIIAVLISSNSCFGPLC